MLDTLRGFCGEEILGGHGPVVSFVNKKAKRRMVKMTALAS